MNVEQLRAEFERSLQWSDKVSQRERQMVLGNLQSFAQFLAGRLESHLAEESRVASSMTTGEIAPTPVENDDEVTSPEVASLASRGLANPTALTPEEIRQICASALTQAPSRSKG